MSPIRRIIRNKPQHLSHSGGWMTESWWEGGYRYFNKTENNMTHFHMLSILRANKKLLIPIAGKELTRPFCYTYVACASIVILIIDRGLHSDKLPNLHWNYFFCTLQPLELLCQWLLILWRLQYKVRWTTLLAGPQSHVSIEINDLRLTHLIFRPRY